MTYTELCEAVASTVENTFADADLARFAALTEQKVFNTTNPPVLRATAELTCTSGSPYVTVPTDGFLRPLSVFVEAGGTLRGLLPKDPSYLTEAFATSANSVPRAYAMFDGTRMVLGPTPDASYSLNLTYSRYPESIVTAGSTWLGDTFDSVLFNGMVLEAARFLKLEQDMLTLYSDRFNASLAEFKNYVDSELSVDDYRV